MNPQRSYDYLSRARQHVLEPVLTLTPDEYTREFPISLGSVARVLTHIVASEWYYVQRLQGLDTPPVEQWPLRDDQPPEAQTLVDAWRRQADQTRAAIDAVTDWNAVISYELINDDGDHLSVSASAGDIFTQLAFHEVHHRAQVLNMLRQLNRTVADIDYNWLMYSIQKR